MRSIRSVFVSSRSSTAVFRFCGHGTVVLYRHKVHFLVSLVFFGSVGSRQGGRTIYAAFLVLLELAFVNVGGAVFVLLSIDVLSGSGDYVCFPFACPFKQHVTAFVFLVFALSVIDSGWCSALWLFSMLHFSCLCFSGGGAPCLFFRVCNIVCRNSNC